MKVTFSQEEINIKLIEINNYLCARPEEGTNMNLKFVWAVTGTKELGPIKFCQGQQSMDKGKINSRCLLVFQSYIQNFSEI